MLLDRAPRVLVAAALLLLVACSSSLQDRADAGGAVAGAAGSVARQGGAAGTSNAAGGPGGGGASGRGGAGGIAGGDYTGDYAGAAGAPVCGRGGSGGSGARGGTGGPITSEPFPCQTFPGIPDCPASGPACGNGVRDTCIRTEPANRCPRISFTEPCDGTDNVGPYCRDMGFGSGDVACSASCTFDTSGCSECIIAAPLAGCGPAPVTNAQPLATAVAATDAEVALAWAEQTAGQAPTLHFARLSPSLDLLGATTALPDAAFAAASGGLQPPPTLAVAPLPSGWVVAGYAAPEVFLHAIDATGQVVGRLVIAEVPAAEAASGVPILAARPDGGPLVVWSRAGEVRAAVVAADGRSTTAPVVLSTTGAAPTLGSPSAIYGWDAFSVAFSVDGGANRRQLWLVRVAIDGTVTGSYDALRGTNVWNATLGPSQAFGSSDLTVVYQSYADPCVTDQGFALYAHRISRTGVPLGDAVLVGRPGQYDGWAESPAFANGAALLLLREGSWHSTLSVGWVKPQGKEFGVASQFAVDPTLPFRSLSLVRRGNDAIAAWLAPPRPGIRIARLTY